MMDLIEVDNDNAHVLPLPFPMFPLLFSGL